MCVSSLAAGNKIGDSGCSALANALPHLSALQELILRCNLILFNLFFVDCIVSFGLDAWPASGVCGFTRCR